MKRGLESERPGDGGWSRMLRAVPVKNAAAEVAARDADGTVHLAVPTKRPSWAVPPVTWIVRPPGQRRLALDAVGAAVWEACDGRRTTEDLVVFLAKKHSLTFHESRVSVTAYVRTLLQRGALAVVMR